MASTRSYGTGRSEAIQFRVTPPEKERLLQEAKRLEFKSLNDYCRYVLLQATPDLDSAQAELKELTGLENEFQSLAARIRARHGMGGKKVV